MLFLSREIELKIQGSVGKMMLIYKYLKSIL